MHKIILLICLSTISTFNYGLAQLGNPTLNLTLKHPPALGITVQKVAFNTSNSECTDQVLNAVISDFVTNGVEVIDRDNLNSILAEHDLSLSGYLDKTSAVSIGTILGPSALITLKILRCETTVNDNLFRMENRKGSDGKTYSVKVYVAQTSFVLKASIQVTDLSSGKIFAAKTFDYSEMKETTSVQGKVLAPSSYEVQEIAFRDLTFDIHKLFFYWNEPMNLIFFDDKTCNLNAAFDYLKINDFQQALDQSIQNLELCEGLGEKEKFLAHSFYNVATCYFLNNKYDEAIEYYNKSNQVKNDNRTNSAILKCQKAKMLSEMSTDIIEKAEMEQSNLELVKSEKESSLLKNEDIVNLTKSKLPESLIIQKIKTSNCKFDTSTDGLLLLINAGVSESVIAAMMEK